MKMAAKNICFRVGSSRQSLSGVFFEATGDIFENKRDFCLRLADINKNARNIPEKKKCFSFLYEANKYLRDSEGRAKRDPS
jgi:hypothetical protein